MNSEQLELDLGYMVECGTCGKQCTRDEVWQMGACHACFNLSLDA